MDSLRYDYDGYLFYKNGQYWDFLSTEARRY